MGTNNINTNTTTHNAGFPPAPPETRQQAGVVKQKKPRLYSIYTAFAVK